MNLEQMKAVDLRKQKFMGTLFDAVDQFDVRLLDMRLYRYNIDIFEENEEGLTALQYAEKKLRQMEEDIENLRRCLNFLKKEEDKRYELIENDDMILDVKRENEKCVKVLSNLLIVTDGIKESFNVKSSSSVDKSIREVD